MVAAFSLGLLYFAVVFSFAFATGVARVLVVAPEIGTTAAVLFEVPVIVVVSGIVAHRLLRHRSLTLGQRGDMGAIAFALTMMSEAALSYSMQGQSVADWVATLATPLGLVGLAGQVAFGLMPMLLTRRSIGA